MAINDRFFKNTNYPHVSWLGEDCMTLCKKSAFETFLQKKISFTVIVVHQYLTVWDELQIEK